MIPETPPTSPKKSFWKKAALPIGVLAIAGMGGTLWARKFVYEDIVPIVQDSLQKELNRPVKIGKIEQFGLSSLRIGKSEIPATPQDSDHAEIDAIDVRFDLWEAIQRRKLKIKVDLVNPTAFIEEDKPGVWIATELAAKKDDDYAGDVEVSEIKLSNATLELLPIAKTPVGKEKQQPKRSVKLQKVNTTIEVFDRGKNLKISSAGESAAQGNFDIKAEVWNRTGDATATKSVEDVAKSTSDKLVDSKSVDSKPAAETLSLDINGEVRTQKMLLSEVDRLARLPVNVESGELSSNLNLQVRTNEKYPSLKGTATYRDIAFKAPGVAYGVSKVEGDLRFDGQKITLEKSKALVAKAIDVNTSGTIDFNKGINLTAKTNSVAIPKLLKAFDIKSPVTVAGEILTEVNITGPIETPRISGQVKNTKPIALTPPQENKNAKAPADIRFTTAQTKFTIDPKTSKLGITSLSVIPELGGSITGSGTIALAKPESISLQLQATGLDADKIVKTYTGQALPVKAGTVAANINISGPPTAPKTFIAWRAPESQYPASGDITIAGTSAGTTLITIANTTAQLEGGTANIAGTIDDGKLAFNVKTDGLPLKPLSPELRGTLSSNLDITGNLENLSPETIRIAGSTRLSEGVAIVNDPIVAQIEWTGKQLNIKEATAPGLFVNGSIVPRLGDKPDIASIDLNVRTQGFSLASIPPDLSNGVKLSGTTDSDIKITGNATNISLLGDVALNSVNVNTNTVAASSQSLTIATSNNPTPAPNITARLNLALNGLQVNDLKIDPLRGTVAYGTNQGVDINLAGRRDRIIAKLDSNFQPISANLRRGDSTLDAVRSGNGLNVAMRRIDLSELNGFGLEKPLTQILAQTPIADDVGTPTLGGQLNGNVAINLNNQQLQSGNIQIDRLQFGNVRATNLIANVQNGNLTSQSLAKPPGTGIASASVVINQLNSPRLTAQSLRANVQNINIASGAISGAAIEINQPQLLGATATQIVASLGPGNFKTGQSGTLTVSQPRVGREQAEDLKAAFFVSSTQFNLQQSTLRLPLKDDRGKLTGEIGSLALKGNVNFQSLKAEAEMEVIDGQFQDILRTAQLFSIDDAIRAGTLASQGTIPLPQYDSAADVQPSAIGDPNASVLKQLKRFAEINQIIAQTAEARSTTPIPTSLDIRGRFNGKVKVAGSLNRPDQLTASFKVNAKTLEWRPYRSYFTTSSQNKLETNINRILKAENAVLEGGIENGVLSVRPFLLKSGDTTIRLSSVQLGEVEQQSGQLKIENLPVEAIQEFFSYSPTLAGTPIGLSGNLNGTITLSGERNKPNFVGFVNLADGLLNGQPLQSAVGSFNYQDGRINFKNTIVANSSEPIAIVGELPYDLDLPILGKSISPDRSFKVTGRVKDDGLSILNMLGQPIAWQGGKGQLNFDVSSGAGQPLKVQGELLLDGAIIKAQALPEALTNVRGRVTADFTGINVQELRGEFSRGQVVASGSIPLFGYAPPELPEEPAPPVTPTATAPSNKPKPLLVDLQKLSINLKGLYQGSVNGRMVIGGSALDPKIGGNITLTEGRISLDDSPPANLLPGSKDNGRPPFELKNLKLRLGDNIRVVRAPILNFVAQGDLEVTGTLDKLQPKGRIALNAGQVNLFTTQFVLARGYRNFAEFRPETGLDPNLDVRLITAVPEVTRTRIPSNNITSEISQGLNLAGNVGGVQTIRIQARVEGPASRLTQKLELKSSPSRSSSEIVSLLGGGFVNTLGRGDDATLGIANFAGSALLTNVQGIIGNAIGLSEFRLFPTLIGNSNNQTSTLGLAAEAGVDLIRTTDGLPVVSATALRVLTAPNQTTQFGLRYRINEQILFRGSTDFSGDNRAVFEFEGRF